MITEMERESIRKATFQELVKKLKTIYSDHDYDPTHEKYEREQCILSELRRRRYDTPRLAKKIKSLLT